MNFFNHLEAVRVGPQRAYITKGTHVLEVDSLSCMISSNPNQRKGTPVLIAKFFVISSDNRDVIPRSAVNSTWVITPLDDRDPKTDHDRQGYDLQEIRAMYMAILGLHGHQDHELAAMMEANGVTFPQLAEYACSAANPFLGKKVVCEGVEVERKGKEPFIRRSWHPYVQQDNIPF